MRQNLRILCADSQDCRDCALFMGSCTGTAKVGDACQMDEAESAGIAAFGGVCYGGEDRAPGLPCVGECMCRFAANIVQEEFDQLTSQAVLRIE